EASGAERRFFVEHVLHSSVIVVLLSHHLQLLPPYSAVETGITFFSLPSFIFTFLLPPFAKPGTSAVSGGGRLNVYDAIRSSVACSRTLRARSGKGAALSPGPPVLGIFSFGDPVRLTLSSSYWPIQWTIAPISKPCIHVSTGPS